MKCWPEQRWGFEWIHTNSTHFKTYFTVPRDLTQILFCRRGSESNVEAGQCKSGTLIEAIKVRYVQMEREKCKSAGWWDICIFQHQSCDNQVFQLSWVQYLTGHWHTTMPPSCLLWPPPPLHTSWKLAIHSLHFSLVFVESFGWVEKRSCFGLQHVTMGYISKLDLNKLVKVIWKAPFYARGFFSDFFHSLIYVIAFFLSVYLRLFWICVTIKVNGWESFG